ncbi:hypothetical protein V6N13_060395 [Hibiscus sabdariffa]|uniref:Uncharacterized protein n=1 Tax=Hibiscus sabdariffa TaxID=183260 RepID=A0ABR2GAF7_9ROSI
MFGDTKLCIVEKHNIPEYIEKEENNEVGELNKSSLLLLVKQVKYLGDIYQGKNARVFVPPVSDSTTREEGVGVGSELCNAGKIRPKVAKGKRCF